MLYASGAARPSDDHRRHRRSSPRRRAKLLAATAVSLGLISALTAAALNGSLNRLDAGRL